LRVRDVRGGVSNRRKAETRAIFGRSYAAEPDVLIAQLKRDEAVAEADTLLLTVPSQLGVAYNAHVIEAILTQVAPALGWRRRKQQGARERLSAAKGVVTALAMRRSRRA
jgi:hypothetical protein